MGVPPFAGGLHPCASGYRGLLRIGGLGLGGHDLGRIGERLDETLGGRIVVAGLEGLGLVALHIGAQFLQQGVAALPGLFRSHVSSLVRQCLALLLRGLHHGSLNLVMLGDELVLQGVQVGSQTSGNIVTVVGGERVDVHHHIGQIVIPLAGLFGGLFTILSTPSRAIISILMIRVQRGERAVVLIHLSQQSRVVGDGDRKLVAAEREPLHRGDLRIHSALHLEDMGFQRPALPDGVESGRICIKIRAFPTSRKSADHVVSAIVRTPGREEQGEVINVRDAIPLQFVPRIGAEVHTTHGVTAP